MSATSTPRRKPTFPGSLTDLHRFRKTAHGHDGSSRIVMVRKTDQRTFASMQNGQEPKLETITRETIETFRGERTECKITTETKDIDENCPRDLIEALTDKSVKKPSVKRKNPKMDFQNECLQAHNEYRTRHGVPPLKLNRDMCKVSQDWANHLIKKGVLQHSSNRDYGENLFCIQSTNPHFTIDGKEAVQNWYDEIKCYKFGLEPSSLAAGHFTQVVWKESKEIGVAYAKSGGKIVVVANYSPPGNIIGFFTENVPPPGGFRANNNHIDLSSNMSHLSLSNSKFSHKSTQNITEGNFEEDFLEAHNIYRQRHGVPPLKLDKKLCKYSEEWAKHLAQRNILEHRPGSNYGENIYCLYSSDPNFTVNGHTPVDTWYEEVVHHPFGKEPCSLKSGHFSQVIWKSSEFLGVGVAKNSQNSIYVVANYSPAGNFVGHYVENVPPVKPAFYGDMMAQRKIENKTVFEPTKSSSIAAGNFNQFCLDALKVHNEYRRRHGVPDLRLSEKICKYAQEWADTCAKTSSLQHRANCPYGENIFSVYSSDFSHTPTARDAVKEWYDEVKQHVFGIEKVNQQSLHFSQVIWKNTKELGIGFAKNKRGQTYVVANYEPRGNFIGQFVENVPRPKS
nr:uncharacterized protein LOC111509384 isoform X2 [Leptinotarsa decemlineata]XP_023020882.1 uncharacterized protein LOC111509384 isoform X2 [Leptinotarsa decemlineata]XP_023020883.1 uncharacterized protein LOC111509384 isoform X2 [Leptinotarsa decemlineata]XP_023020884.1 uncharacterized protein LOC111509384 isoform X2 [Leptinotarsa decemlineata]XP_023020885.1 uncharacterized protein LOC111509384 isoform X2 [Leptinotarsa decemlineata]XP_023020886.1 uncharacterized protein LOC111509384 isoform 